MLSPSSVHPDIPTFLRYSGSDLTPPAAVQAQLAGQQAEALSPSSTMMTMLSCSLPAVFAEQTVQPDERVAFAADHQHLVAARVGDDFIAVVLKTPVHSPWGSCKSFSYLYEHTPMMQRSDMDRRGPPRPAVDRAMPPSCAILRLTTSMPTLRPSTPTPSRLWRNWMEYKRPDIFIGVLGIFADESSRRALARIFPRSRPPPSSRTVIHTSPPVARFQRNDAGFALPAAIRSSEVSRP